MTDQRTLPKELFHDFIICDNSVNRYGWRLLVEGIDLTNFKKNPVCCVVHETERLSIGKWTKLEVKNGQLIGRLIFDRNDTEAVRLYWKYEDGYMNAVSLNVLPLEESEAKELLIPGQKYATLVKSEMLEISCVTLPGQGHAVKLTYENGKEYKLSLVNNSKIVNMSKVEKTVDELKAELDASKKLNAKNLVTIHQNRGVVTPEEVKDWVELAFENPERAERMLSAKPNPVKPVVENGKTDAIETAETKALALVGLHSSRLGFTVDEKKMYANAATLDYDGTKKVIEAMRGKDHIESFAQDLSGGQGSAQKNDRASWTYLDYYKKDMKALDMMKAEEPEKYNALELAFKESAEADGISVED